MEDKIKKDLEDILNFNSDSEAEIEEFRVKYLGKKGLLNSYFVEFKSLESDEKKKLGSLLNCLLYTSPSPRDPKTSRMPSSA